MINLIIKALIGCLLFRHYLFSAKQLIHPFEISYFEIIELALSSIFLCRFWFFIGLLFGYIWMLYQLNRKSKQTGEWKKQTENSPKHVDRCIYMIKCVRTVKSKWALKRYALALKAHFTFLLLLLDLLECMI